MTISIPNIEVFDRDMSTNPRQSRREGRIPATIYGKKEDSMSLVVDKKSFTYLYYNQNPNLVSLTREGKVINAVVKNVQTDPITNEVLNIEFIRVKEDQKVKISVPISLEGESPVVKLGATLLQILDEVEIECFPQHIPEKIVIDLSKLTEVGISLTIAELNYPEGVVSTQTPDTAVLNVIASRAASDATEDGEAGATAGSAAATAAGA